MYDYAKVLKAAGCSSYTVELWTPVFERTIKDNTFSAGIRDFKDFLPTVIHESGRLTYVKENGSYSAERIVELGMKSDPGTRWRSLVPRAKELARNPYKFFEACYGGRLGNRPEGSGDGANYCGRGLIQVTGRANYEWLGNLLGQDLLVLPHLMEQPHYALESAIAWWEGKIPDSILGQAKPIRKVVNGGYFGVAEVEALAKKIAVALA